MKNRMAFTTIDITPEGRNIPHGTARVIETMQELEHATEALAKAATSHSYKKPSPTPSSR